jgi:hypothetical protein
MFVLVFQSCIQRLAAMACAAITSNCSAFFHCVKVNNFTFCPQLLTAAWTLSRLLWFHGVESLPRWCWKGLLW